MNVFEGNPQADDLISAEHYRVGLVACPKCGDDVWMMSYQTGRGRPVMTVECCGCGYGTFAAPRDRKA